MIYESQGLFGLSKPCVTRHTNSLIIYVSLGAVCAVESVRLPCQHFVDDL